MEKRYDVITSGYVSMDRIIKLQSPARVGFTSLVSNKTSADICYGGCSVNISYDLCRLGVNSMPIMRVGDDYEEIGFKGFLEQAGISLEATELVTKCPSKYESATDALTVGQLLGYGESVHGKVVKVSGTVGAGTLGPAGQDVRFRLTDDESLSVTLPVSFDGALSDEVADGSAVVLTGALGADGTFAATDVALEG